LAGHSIVLRPTDAPEKYIDYVKNHMPLNYKIIDLKTLFTGLILEDNNFSNLNFEEKNQEKVDVTI
jgi:hypothetical protein